MSTAPQSSGVLPTPVSSVPLPSASSEHSETSGTALTLEGLAGVMEQFARHMDQIGRTVDALSLNVSTLQQSVAGLLPPPPPPPASQPPPPPPAPMTSLPTSFSLGMPQGSQGVPLRQLRWPASPSPIPSWALMGTTPPVYTSATTVTPSAVSTTVVPSATASGTFYGGTDGSLLYGSAPALSAAGSSGHPDAHAPPRFYKLEFATYDGGVDPLNWLNQCEQFFRGQRTLASDRTWLASYHLRGAAQTWYYALEQDEGMLAWERFHELCQLRFGPPTQGTRLAELARLPFTSTVADYSERYNAVLCHEPELNAR